MKISCTLCNILSVFFLQLEELSSSMYPFPQLPSVVLQSIRKFAFCQTNVDCLISWMLKWLKADCFVSILDGLYADKNCTWLKIKTFPSHLGPEQWRSGCQKHAPSLPKQGATIAMTTFQLPKASLVANVVMQVFISQIVQEEYWSLVAAEAQNMMNWPIQRWI